MHTQMMPTWTSTEDQMQTSKKSQVGLTVLAAAETSDRSRSILTMVTLQQVRRHLQRRDGRYSQGTNAEHHRNANLLSQVQLETLQLPEGNSQHPGINDNAHGGIRPANSHNVDAPPLMRRVSTPLPPVVVDGSALERSQKHIDDAEDGHGGDRSPEQAADSLAREDSYVKEEERKASRGQYRRNRQSPG